ncbi:homocysteine S-methyltransferase [Streptomyces hygroscopicus]|uniref:homocysteine S-methyltransferase n=1 Tax=Streptomyces hygroscopicus TaxID=1912 RepID=UPI000767DD44|nr:homocysteine S-methyltransferase [Streptomyces hygroscopicus]GLV74133.1 homocysteine S-methyltransferase [Streptomyces hygroscopicus subsp. hygroscopicus]
MTSIPPSSLAAALRHGPLVLDGGLSNQLEAQGCDLSDELWSARLLADDPGQIEAAHTAYARAGARVLITSSYQATYEGFGHRGVGREEATALLRRSVELARRAAERAVADRAAAERSATDRAVAERAVAERAGAADRGAEPVWVAASVGPYGAMLADGSEYRGRYGLSVAELERFHRPRIEALAAAGPDVLALETVPDADEAAAMLRAVEGCGVPVWLSYSIAGETTRAGQPLRDAFAVAAGVDQVIAVGVNCCEPGDADRAVEIAADTTDKPVVVYPNSGEEWDATARSWRGRATFDPGRVTAWHDAGARLIGGCCRVGPERIAELAAMVRNH